jgi:hypothetical protein
MEWIRCSERMPPDGVEVLFVAFGQDVEVGRHYHQEWTDLRTDSQNEAITFDDQCVTHWMPLPEPPKEQA